MDNFRLDKWHTIKSSEKFREIFRDGTKYHSKNILLLLKESKDTKFGFTVSKKIKGAVKRNRAKRRLKEVLRLNQKAIPKNKNIILVAKAGIERENFQLLNEELLEVIKKLSLKEE